MRFRTISAVLFLIFIATSLRAADKPQVQKDLGYVPDGEPAQTLDLYPSPQASEKPLPLIVWIHGGGWQGGSKAGCPALEFLSRGYVVASVEYRFSQKALFPAQIQDCQAAIRWLRANSKKYNIAPDHIGVWGESAGGHLVALLGTSGGKKAFAAIGGNDDQSDRVQAVCDFYGPADFHDVVEQAASDKDAKNIFKFSTGDEPYSKLIGVHVGSDKQKDDAVSPVHYVTKDNPPFLILHGSVDQLVPYAQSVELADDLEKAGVSVVLQKLPGAGHGGPQFGQPKMKELIANFFDKNLQGKDVEVKALPDDQVMLSAPGK